MITWRPMTDTPTGPASAMIRATDHEGTHLLPGPVMWSIVKNCWADESSGLPIAMTQPGAVYEWCEEGEIVGAGGTPSGWIATAERLPDDDMTVLIALADGEVWTGWHDGDDGWRYVSADPVGAEVRYWREFPEPPEALRNAPKGTAP